MNGERTDPDGRGLSWSQETTHFPAPLTRWAAALYVDEESRVIRELCTEYGLLLDGIEMKEFEGWVYTAQVPLGGKARRPPPSFLVPVLRRLVPALRTRIAAARRAEATDAFAQVVERWVGGKEQAMLDEGQELLARDLGRLDDASLADLVESAMGLALRGAAEHFRLHGAGVNEIGRLGLALGKRGWSTADVCELFTGLSDTSTGPAAAQAEIVERARATGGLDALRGARSLDDVRAIGAEVADAVEDYLARWATRAVRYEVSEPTVAERPEWLLKVLQETATATPAAPRAAEHAE
ncbi:MAG: hypothetical protein H0U89_12155, partial [Acidimicrobiia bacterium]|nr:hypothetical protein [Acidimicrobiia bacterium]